MEAAVRVLCRFRPVNNREKEEARQAQEAGAAPGSELIASFLSDDVVEICGEGTQPTKKFTFDRVFPPTTSQETVYSVAARDTVEQVFQGYNGTIFAYGQTGSGKSFTMFGPESSVTCSDSSLLGIIPRVAEHIFNKIMHGSAASADAGGDSLGQEIEYAITVQFLEIYNEKISDLLCATEPTAQQLKSGLPIRENEERGVYVEGATSMPIGSAQELFQVIEFGEARKHVAETMMNKTSSRSHTILQLLVSQTNKTDGSKREGKLCLVDLAGSEKVSKTGVDGLRLEEATNINLSLTNLGICIKALVEKAKHVPFRNSKLTRILQDGLGGNSKTTLIITCSPHRFNREETMSTCEFGKRAKLIKNKVRANVTKSVKELMMLNKRLLAELASWKAYCGKLEEALQWFVDAHGVGGAEWIATLLRDKRNSEMVLAMEGDAAKYFAGLSSEALGGMDQGPQDSRSAQGSQGLQEQELRHSASTPSLASLASPGGSSGQASSRVMAPTPGISVVPPTSRQPVFNFDLERLKQEYFYMKRDLGLEIDQLQERVDTLSAENARLSSALQTAQEANAALTSQKAQAEGQSGVALQKVKAYDDKISALQAEVDRLKADSRSKEASAASARSEAATLKDKLSKLSADKGRTDQALSAARQEAKDFSAEAERLRAENASIMAILRSGDSSVDSAPDTPSPAATGASPSAGAPSALATEARLRKNVSVLERQLSDARAVVQTLRAEQAQARQAQTRLQASEEQVATLTTELAERAKKEEALRAATSILTSVAVAKAKELSSLEAVLAEQRSQLDASLAQVEQLSASLESLRREHEREALERAKEVHSLRLQLDQQKVSLQQARMQPTRVFKPITATSAATHLLLSNPGMAGRLQSLIASP